MLEDGWSALNMSPLDAMCPISAEPVRTEHSYSEEATLSE
jgi:hypothetical protein